VPKQHPLAGPPPVDEDGGWLGPVSTSVASPPPPELTESSRQAPVPAEPGYATRRFSDVVLPRERHRGALVFALIGAAVIAIAATALLVLRGPATPTAGAPARTTAGPTATTFISAVAVGAPTNVHITSDQSTKVTVAWSDPTASKVSFVVSRTAGPNETVQTVDLPAGTTSYTFDGLNPARNYCFSVIALYSVNNVAKGPDVCTRR
jgi:hypothetical protein